MFGIGRKKEEETQKINPALGKGATVIQIIAVIIFVVGIQGGIIGGAIFGGIAYGFYYIAIRQLAKYKKVNLSVDITEEERNKIPLINKKNRNLRILLMIGVGIVFLIVILISNANKPQM